LTLVERLLKEIPARHLNPKAVVAWLLAGDAVPNPLPVKSDSLASARLYLQIVEIARWRGTDFNALPREVRDQIIRHLWRHLCKDANNNNAGEELELDPAAMELVAGMLDAAMVARDGNVR